MSVVFHSDAIVTNIGFFASYESLLQDEKNTGNVLPSLQPPALLGDAGLRWPLSHLGARDLKVAPKLPVSYSS